MTRKMTKLHEGTSKHSSKVAATLFRHPESEPSEISENAHGKGEVISIVFKYAGNGGWLCNICKTNAMTVKKAKAHEIRCQGVGATENKEDESGHEFSDGPIRSEGNGDTTSTHQLSDNEDGNEDGNEDEEESDDDDNDDDDFGSDSGSDSNIAFVENFLRNQDVDASHRRRMRSFCKVCCTYTFAVSTLTHKIQDAHRPENPKNSGGD